MTDNGMQVCLMAGAFECNPSGSIAQTIVTFCPWGSGFVHVLRLNVRQWLFQHRQSGVPYGNIYNKVCTYLLTGCVV
jgi:hypothetical protein